jgi:hypothetical protein
MGLFNFSQVPVTEIAPKGKGSRQGSTDLAERRAEVATALEAAIASDQALAIALPEEVKPGDVASIRSVILYVAKHKLENSPVPVVARRKGQFVYGYLDKEAVAAELEALEAEETSSDEDSTPESE